MLRFGFIFSYLFSLWKYFTPFLISTKIFSNLDLKIFQADTDRGTVPIDSSGLPWPEIIHVLRPCFLPYVVSPDAPVHCPTLLSPRTPSTHSNPISGLVSFLPWTPCSLPPWSHPKIVLEKQLPSLLYLTLPSPQGHVACPSSEKPTTVHLRLPVAHRIRVSLSRSCVVGLDFIPSLF